MSQLDLLIFLVPGLPLAATVVTALLGKKVLRGQSHWPTVLALAGSFVLSAILLVQVNRRSAQARESDPQAVGFEYITPSLWTWAALDHAAKEKAPDEQFSTRSLRSIPLKNTVFRIDIVLRSDPLTAVMLVMVTFVSLLVAIYAIGYMHGDPGYWRFFTYIA